MYLRLVPSAIQLSILHQKNVHLQDGIHILVDLMGHTTGARLDIVVTTVQGLIVVLSLLLLYFFVINVKTIIEYMYASKLIDRELQS